MFEEASSAIAEAESRTEETRGFIKRVRRITRRKYTPEEKIRIVLGGIPTRGANPRLMPPRRHQAEYVLCLAEEFHGSGQDEAGP